MWSVDGRAKSVYLIQVYWLLFSFINYLCEYVYLRQEIKALVLVLTRMVNSVMVYGTVRYV